MMSSSTNDPALRVEDEQLGWLRHLPASWQDYALLARMDRPIGVWLLLIPCWWGLTLAPQPFRIDLAILFTIGAIAMRGAGCTINDLADREFDAKVERTRNRPLAAGRLQPLQAYLFVAAQLLVGLIVLLLLPFGAQITALAAMPLVIIYPFMKRFTYWPQLFLGITFNWGILVGAVATQGTFAWAAACLYLAGICWTLGYDTIYAHQDKADDLMIGVKSSALKLGSNTEPALWAFYGTTILATSLAMALTEASHWAFLAMTLPALHFIWQIRTLKIDDRPNCLQRFRANRTAGLLILMALLVGQYGP